eukprot:CAMPEP_0184508788 /NCGR_PEP_ID=MMETSP0198_2-20121128/942_1 /TAXON_ID=1112570 /ORGANISM="Thraustochytrium sp., Strain LLF1b" /LENGTH=199 /DNA_ID=CAMNT_0026898585 /DNA_START=80 /DNA_END=679 /DNA_ORIENTATION=-
MDSFREFPRDESVGADETSFLGEDLQHNLFPGGTKVFPSQYHWQRRVWVVVAIMCSYTVVMLMTMLLLSAGHRSGTGTILSLLLLVNAGLAALGYRWHQQDFATYEDKIASGLWLEGVFVFSTGDVVVRFNEPFRNVEMEFDSTMVTSAEPRESENKLEIRYTGLDGSPKLYVVDCEELVDSPSAIASCINARDRLDYA